MTTLCARDGNRNGGTPGQGGIRPVEAGFRGNRDCDHPGVIPRSVSRFILICVPLVICAARLHSRAAASPAGVTQDVNRCLTVVRLASSRRGAGTRGHAQMTHPKTDASGLLVSYPPPSVCDIPV